MATNDLADALSFEEKLRLARDPATAGATLGEIAEEFLLWGSILIGIDGGPPPELGRDPRDIWRALALNPNTPPRLLARLAVKLPEEFCRNPVAAVLTLEEPRLASWVGDEYGYDAADLLRRADAPATLVAAMSKQARHKATREEAAMHVAVAGEAGDGWRDDIRKIVRRQARALRGDNRQMLLDLIEAGVAPGWLADADAPAEEPPGPDFSGVWGKAPRAPAAADPDAPAATLLQLAGRRNRAIDAALAQNPATPAEALLLVLDNFGEAPPRRAVARRPDLPPVVVQKLVEWHDPVILRTLRRRGYGTGDDGYSPRLRRESAWAAAMHWGQGQPVLPLLALAGSPPEFTAEELGKLLQDGAQGSNWVLRLAVPFSRHTAGGEPAETATLLSSLAEDGNRLVRAAARARLRGEEVTL